MIEIIYKHISNLCSVICYIHGLQNSLFCGMEIYWQKHLLPWLALCSCTSQLSIPECFCFASFDLLSLFTYKCNQCGHGFKCFMLIYCNGQFQTS